MGRDPRAARPRPADRLAAVLVAQHRPGHRGAPACDRSRRRRARGSALRARQRRLCNCRGRALGRGLDADDERRRRGAHPRAAARGRRAGGAGRRLHPGSRRGGQRASSACSQRPRPSSGAASVARSSGSPRSTAAGAVCVRSSSSCSRRASGGIRPRSSCGSGTAAWATGCIRRASVGDVYPGLVPLLLGPCEIETYEKALRPEPPSAPLLGGRSRNPGARKLGIPTMPRRTLVARVGSTTPPLRDERFEMTFPMLYRATPARRAALFALALLALALGFSATGVRRRRRHRDDRRAAARDGRRHRARRLLHASTASTAPTPASSSTAATATTARAPTATSSSPISRRARTAWRRTRRRPRSSPRPGRSPRSVGDGDTVTVTRIHEPLPPLRVVTNGEDGKALAGSCWRIHSPGEYEGYIAEACDGDDGANDGTTTFKTIRPGDYEIRHMEAPTPVPPARRRDAVHDARRREDADVRARARDRAGQHGGARPSPARRRWARR